MIPVVPALATSFDDGFNAGKEAADRDATALQEGDKRVQMQIISNLRQSMTMSFADGINTVTLMKHKQT